MKIMPSIMNEENIKTAKTVGSACLCNALYRDKSLKISLTQIDISSDSFFATFLVTSLHRDIDTSYK